MIPRLHLVELEDESWFPTRIRDYATDYLRFVEAKLAMHRPIAEILAGALEATRADRIVDLCSGGAGPIPALAADLAEDGLPVRFTLTDRYPNLAAFEAVARDSQGTIEFVGEPVDARSVPRHLAGFRTLFNAFHHFRPADAEAILRDAAEAGQPIAVIDTADRRPASILGIMLLTPIMVQLTAPMIRPFSWGRLFWTYFVPLVGLTCWWDGIVSQLRAYTPAEMERLAAGAQAAGYEWQVGQKSFGPGPGRLTYVLGRRKGEA